MFLPGGVADEIVVDPLLEERMHLILTQLVAFQAVVQMIRQRAPMLNPPDSLFNAISVAEDLGLIVSREAGVLRAVNRAGNQAKHALALNSRL